MLHPTDLLKQAPSRAARRPSVLSDGGVNKQTSIRGGIVMATEVASIRVEKGTVRRLKLLASRRSLEAGRPIPWTELVRDALDKLLVEADERASAPVQD